MTSIEAVAQPQDRAYSFLYVGGGHEDIDVLGVSRTLRRDPLNAVTDDREEVVITRAGHDPVVMVALDDYESLKETAYLLRSPENARRLLAAIDRLEHGAGATRDLLDSAGE